MRKASFISSTKEGPNRDEASIVSASSFRKARQLSTSSSLSSSPPSQNQNQSQVQQHESRSVTSVSAAALLPASSLTSLVPPTQRAAAKSFIALNRKNAAKAPAKSSAATAVKWEKLEDNLMAQIEGGGDGSYNRRSNYDKDNKNSSSANVDDVDDDDDDDEIDDYDNQNKANGTLRHPAGGGVLENRRNSNSNSNNNNNNNNSNNYNSNSNNNKLETGSNTSSTASVSKQSASGTTSAGRSSSKQVTLRRRYRGTAAILQKHETSDANDGNASAVSAVAVTAAASSLTTTTTTTTSGRSFQRTVENAASLVARSPLFTTLRDRRVIDRIAEAVRWHSAQPGQYIVVAGDVAEDMYFIFSGFVEILLPVSDEDETPVATLQGGDFFGEIALVSREKTLRTASVQAVKQCELLVLSRKDLEEVIAVSDELRECLELEANKRLASLRQREATLFSDDVDVDRELLKKASQNPLSAIECEWRLLSRARLRGSHRSQPPPSSWQDALAWARQHRQHTPWPMHGRTTAALSRLPSSWLDAQTSSSSSPPPSADVANRLLCGDALHNNNNNDNGNELLLLHPEMGCVYKYSAVIDALAGPDEFDNLCRSIARLLLGRSARSSDGNAVLQKQSLGSLALAAQVTLFFSHNSAKKHRVDFLVDHVATKVSRLAPDEQAILSLSRETALPTFTFDQSLLSEMTGGLSKAPCWSVSTSLLFEQYPKSFVLSDAWAVVTLERIAMLREECIRQACVIVIDQMIERHLHLVRRYRIDRAQIEQQFKTQRGVIKTAIAMLRNLESVHRARLGREVDAAAAGLWRWHECCLSFVSNQKSSQEAALAGQLESFHVASTSPSSHDHPHRRRQGDYVLGNHSNINSNNNNIYDVNSSRLSLFVPGNSEKEIRGDARARSAGGVAVATGSGNSSRSSVGSRAGIAMLVAQKERMADEAIHFQKRVKMSRY